ncbi:helix-turn-helix protein [Pseudomonas sp. 29]|jgi:transcriptional regulator with XRE-family HTH domain|uniref:helix-turn-helix domain-containing protein n=1 Tax=Pseudomonas sp. 29 TaxID=2035197 RepID=UPI000C1A1234|nr:helix-turn-helix protein [Pseudomonas sp. 29]
MKSANDPMYIEFIARLRAYRKDKNITQSDLALALNRPQSYVSKVETCERRIDVIETALWCSVLGIEIVSVLPRSLTQSK